MAAAGCPALKRACLSAVRFRVYIAGWFAPDVQKKILPHLAFLDALQATSPEKEMSSADPMKEEPRVPDPTEEMPHQSINKRSRLPEAPGARVTARRGVRRGRPQPAGLNRSGSDPPPSHLAVIVTGRPRNSSGTSQGGSAAGLL